jgi:NADPH:quinone reductase-like Zn-dependent oxidoreductase
LSIPDEPLLICKQIFITYTSESEKEHFLQAENMPADCLVPAYTPTWTKNLKGLLGGREIGVIIASVAANNHQDLWKCLKKNGKYLLLDGGSNVPNLSTFDKSVFSRGASFISFDILDMLQEGGEDIKE